jgi:phosphatidylglycerol:prolipoprotein diacylglycerol transferase
LTLNRVAFTLFGHNFFWYGSIIAFGFLLAVLWCYRQAPQFGIVSDTLIDMLIFAVPISIICARIYYIIFYLDLFRDSSGNLVFGKMVRIWDGGIAIYGGIIGGILTLFVFCKIKKLPFGAFADLGCMGLLIGQCVGRWGNFVNVEAYGSETTLPWRMGIYDAGTYLQVHPTFLYESLWNLLGFFLIALILKNRRKFDGQLFLSYIGWYGLGRMFIEGLRTDSLYIPGTVIRVSQMLAAVTFILAVSILIYVLVLKKPTSKTLFVNGSDNELLRKKAVNQDTEEIIKETKGDECYGTDHGRESTGSENQNTDEN